MRGMAAHLPARFRWRPEPCRQAAFGPPAPPRCLCRERRREQPGRSSYQPRFRAKTRSSPQLRTCEPGGLPSSKESMAAAPGHGKETTDRPLTKAAYPGAPRSQPITHSGSRRSCLPPREFASSRKGAVLPGAAKQEIQVRWCEPGVPLRLCRQVENSLLSGRGPPARAAGGCRLFARIGHPPDGVRAVVGDQQRSILGHGDAHRTAPHLAVGKHEAGEEVFIFSRGLAAAMGTVITS